LLAVPYIDYLYNRMHLVNCNMLEW